ncbi:MAG: YdcF family protein [Clostridiales Family XIII bacterium]|jgi:vancomycin permeability regulator SanA|nr:YdcF family protein [Clostridiales Family XIII bacterium]
MTEKRRMRKSGERRPRRMKRGLLRSIIRLIIVCVVVAVLTVGVTNIIVIMSVRDRVVTANEAASIAADGGKFRCAEVLGASVKSGEPTPMLAERIDMGMELVKVSATDILLFSGDNGTNEYNEVAAMKRYAIEGGATYGVGEDNIYLDYAGFSTYDSMYRLRDVFGADRALIVTQKYHLYRALYIAGRLGIEAYGVAAEPRKSGQFRRDVREIFARTKDFFYVLTDKKPKYLGEPVYLVYPAGQSQG